MPISNEVVSSSNALLIREVYSVAEGIAFCRIGVPLLALWYNSTSSPPLLQLPTDNLQLSLPAHLRRALNAFEAAKT